MTSECEPTNDRMTDQPCYPAGSTEELFSLLYQELRLLAQTRIRQEKQGHTLEATALVHEVMLRLLGRDERWSSKNHFYAAAAQAMRRVLIDHARQKDSIRRGGDWNKVELSESILGVLYDHEQLIDLDDALSHLAEFDARSARIAELRVFTGLTFQEIAEVLMIPLASAHRDWTFARAWLTAQLSDGHRTR